MGISSAIRLLGDILGEVVTELKSYELFETKEYIRLAAGLKNKG